MTATPHINQTTATVPEAAAAQFSRKRRCVTLLELLIVLALLAGLAALALPSVLDRMDERAFEAAADTASEQLMMARAHAQATGDAVEVTYSPATGKVQARVYAPWNSDAGSDSNMIEPGTSPLRDPGVTAGLTRVSDHDGEVGLASSSSSHDAQGRAISEPWASRELGSGISIARKRSGFPFLPGFEGQSESNDAAPSLIARGSTSSDNDFETLEDLANGQEVRLAVFMPDGSALVGDEVFLNDKSGRCGRLSVNPWSGLPMFERLANMAAQSAEADRDQNDADARRDHADSTSRDATGDMNDDDLQSPIDDAAPGASQRDADGHWGDEHDDD